MLVLDTEPLPDAGPDDRAHHQVKSTFPVLKSPANRHKVVPLTVEEWQYAFTNTFTTVLHLGAVRFGLTGPLKYTTTAAEGAGLCELVRARTVLPVHYEGWGPLHRGPGRGGVGLRRGTATGPREPALAHSGHGLDRHGLTGRRHRRSPIRRKLPSGPDRWGAADGRDSWCTGLRDVRCPAGAARGGPGRHAARAPGGLRRAAARAATRVRAAALPRAQHAGALRVGSLSEAASGRRFPTWETTGGT
jgi:hypothetical protein